MRRRLTVLVAGAVVALTAATSPAYAAPVDATAVTAAQAEVDRVAALVRAAEDELARSTVLAEAAADADRAAQEQLLAAQVAQVTTAAALARAQADTVAAEADVATLGREAFMGQQGFGTAQVLLDSGSPEEVLQRAATLAQLGEDRAQRLDAVELVRDQEQAADTAAQQAVAELSTAASAAAEADTAAQQQVAAAQQSYDAVAAQKAGLDAQLLAAQTALLEAQGVEDAAAAAQAAAAEAVAEVSVTSVGDGSLVAGRVTSCYGSRWGTTHYGVDIAAPIGTPIYVPEGGVVLDAGPANGFGQAVYVQHPDGVVSLYGHVDTFTVRAGQVVSAGQQIATVGNRGQSTGPHVHVETHYGGLYADRRNPVPWLTSHGISVGTCG
ncbi:Murein DD-endopeptidase MepM and murein hydrolase activator NlpD, contain LysM domain [Klenkia marina]|uniref:Murein DD-endopeptidase MepM and murein hydrolase activator NlpD, contain LysM domain n=1 Tax=Klenkia marina TaxID=1960309 RepID=A0A1G4YYE6_9ACTN|nr:M23 family metallopeptidase [Klenkia marina]SCX58472.1 Murein DD-endopeptidase MepM and murein hydrolase activator NlpD, contain LysM domain [Klenkia marina]